MSAATRLLIVMTVVLALAISACGADRPASGPGDTSLALNTGAVVANTPGTITTAGRQRIMTAILGYDTRPFLGGSDQPLSISFRPADGGSTIEVETTWLSTNSTELGLYVSVVDFPTTGSWNLIASADGAEVARTSLQVTEESPVPRIGDRAPATISKTGISADELGAISTDPEPDPDFYALSIAEAIDNGRPTMVAFVTPGLCQSAMCGPTLDAVKAAAAGQTWLDVVHVEPFDLELAATGELRAIPAMAEWGLQTEPWVFVVDADGLVQVSFEGIIGQDELETAIDLVSNAP